MENETPDGELLTIGDLSRLTGLSTHNLRVWEKRHGAPKAVRLASGHRRYPRSELPRLRAIAKALESGYKASKVVSATLEELNGLLGLNFNTPNKFYDQDPGFDIDSWLYSVEVYDEESLNHNFHEFWIQHGPMTFISKYISPFIDQIGGLWSAGDLSISHEHFASQCIGNFLSKKWRQLNQRNNGPVTVLTTLPGEMHEIGLLMGAVVTTLTENRVIYLGTNTPINSIVDTVNQSNAKYLCISCSKCADPIKLEDNLFKLRSDLHKTVSIIIGGSGLINKIPGVIKFTGFSEYYKFMT